MLYVKSKMPDLMLETVNVSNVSSPGSNLQMTLAIDSTTRSMLREFSAATQMRPVSTA